MIEQYAYIHDTEQGNPRDMVTLPNGSIMSMKLAARGNRGWGVDRSDSEAERLERVKFAQAVETISKALAEFDAIDDQDPGPFIACLVDISEAWPTVAAWIKGGKE